MHAVVSWMFFAVSLSVRLRFGFVCKNHSILLILSDCAGRCRDAMLPHCLLLILTHDYMTLGSGCVCDKTIIFFCVMSDFVRALLRLNMSDYHSLCMSGYPYLCLSSCFLFSSFFVIDLCYCLCLSSCALWALSIVLMVVVSFLLL